MNSKSNKSGIRNLLGTAALIGAIGTAGIFGYNTFTQPIQYRYSVAQSADSEIFRMGGEKEFYTWKKVKADEGTTYSDYVGTNWALLELTEQRNGYDSGKIPLHATIEVPERVPSEKVPSGLTLEEKVITGD
ncbi:MAG: hypothetical protein NTV63_05160 [Candidatus Woesearchaeota archaeon]|nr:hypothetical protein [Candidatus Woesearchaeota archaeon]